MDNKLTLKLDNQVIEKAKIYARKKNTSLSKLIEGYLHFLTSSESSSTNDITPLVKSLSGVISLTKDYDYRKDRTDYLIKKYS